MSENRIWHFHHSTTKEQVKNLNDEQALSHVKSLTESESQLWLVWTPGLNDWKHLAEIPEFQKSKNRQRHPRVEIKVNITVISGFQKFQTFTKNLSIGGALLDRALPFTPMHQNCRVILKYADQMDEPLDFNAKLILDGKNPRRLEFISAEPRFKKRLALWIERALARNKEAS